MASFADWIEFGMNWIEKPITKFAVKVMAVSVAFIILLCSPGAIERAVPGNLVKNRCKTCKI